MKMYKIIRDSFDGSEKVILRTSDTTYITRGSGSNGWLQFLQDVKEQGIGIVEGPDIVEDSYVELRQKEYPSWQDQLDKMYHDFDGWKNDIHTIKNKYPKSITGGTSIGAIPDWVQTEVDNLNS